MPTGRVGFMDEEFGSAARCVFELYYPLRRCCGGDAQQRHENLHTAATPAFYFRLDSNMREIDLVIEEGAALKAVEIKAGKTIAPAFTKNLYAFQNLAGADNVELFFVYGGEAGQPRSDLGVLPWNRAVEIVKS